MDPKSGNIENPVGVKRFMTLMKETKTVRFAYCTSLKVGERYLLLAALKSIQRPELIDLCYAKGLLDVFVIYLNENCDVMTNYDYITMLLTILTSFPLPSDTDLQLDSAQLDLFCHCGDPGL